MKMKQVLKSMVVGASMLALASTASAGNYNINLYGASAQHLFWNAAAPGFLTTAAPNGPGCATAVQASYDSKNGITKGENCLGDGSTIYIRYASKASYDGIRSIKNEDPDKKCGVGNENEREMVDETSCNWAGGSCTGLKCQDVLLGASDVGGECFKQTSYGQEDGHRGGPTIYRTFNGIDTTGLTSARPLVVPFGFFVNNAISLSNISRLMAVLIYSGQVGYWDDFGTPYPNKRIVACLRHAGSGTHATLDSAVMHGDAGLLTFEDSTGAFGGPITWFNDGSSDMMKCVDQNGGLATTDYAAIGYADADYDLASYVNTTGPVPYQGITPSNSTIANCVYSFWSAQYVFWDDTEKTADAVVSDIVDDLMAFASDSANMPASKVAWWATQSEMECEKANCWAYPTRK